MIELEDESNMPVAEPVARHPALCEDITVLKMDAAVRWRVESAGVVALFKEVKDEVTTWVDLDTGLRVVEICAVDPNDTSGC